MASLSANLSAMNLSAMNLSLYPFMLIG